MTAKNFNKTAGIIIFTCIIISVTANVLYANSIRLDRPLFVTQYNVVEMNEGLEEEVYIRYITDRGDDRDIVTIEFDGLRQEYMVVDANEGSPFSFIQENQHEPNIGRYYRFHHGKFNLELTEDEMTNLKDQGSISITKATVTFDDGSVQKVDFGEMFILDQAKWDSYPRNIGGGGGDYSYRSDYETNGPMTITGVDFSTYEPHNDALDIEFIVDGKIYTYEDLNGNYEPIQVEKENTFHIKFKSKDPDHSQIWRFSDICLEVTYEKDGQVDSIVNTFSFYGQTMDQETVEKYVKFRRQK